jgi:hypothetical protein
MGTCVRACNRRVVLDRPHLLSGLGGRACHAQALGCRYAFAAAHDRGPPGACDLCHGAAGAPQGRRSRARSGLAAGGAGASWEPLPPPAARGGPAGRRLGGRPPAAESPGVALGSAGGQAPRRSPPPPPPCRRDPHPRTQLRVGGPEPPGQLPRAAGARSPDAGARNRRRAAGRRVLYEQLGGAAQVVCAAPGDARVGEGHDAEGLRMQRGGMGQNREGGEPLGWHAMRRNRGHVFLRRGARG